MSNIYLIGYRCTGKSTVGKLLADRRRMAFLDTDGFLTGYVGCSVTEIIERDGWKRFRELERFALEEAAAGDGLVVATGGGIVLAPENRELMAKTGIVVWLKAGVKTLAKRMGADGVTDSQRPSLTGKGSVDEIAEVLKERHSLYEEAADVTIETDTMTPDQVAGAILKRLLLTRDAS